MIDTTNINICQILKMKHSNMRHELLHTPTFWTPPLKKKWGGRVIIGMSTLFKLKDMVLQDYRIPTPAFPVLWSAQIWHTSTCVVVPWALSYGPHLVSFLDPHSSYKHSIKINKHSTSIANCKSRGALRFYQSQHPPSSHAAGYSYWWWSHPILTILSWVSFWPKHTQAKDQQRTDNDWNKETDQSPVPFKFVCAAEHETRNNSQSSSSSSSSSSRRFGKTSYKSVKVPIWICTGSWR